MIKIKTNHYLKYKIYNFMMLNGKKETCENIFLKSTKLIQKYLTKNHKKLIKLAFVNSAPLIKIKQIKQKRKKNLKEFPFLINQKNRILLAIKSIITTSKKKKASNLYIKIKQEIILSSENKSHTFEKKKKLQGYALTKKKYFHYRWF